VKYTVYYVLRILSFRERGQTRAGRKFVNPVDHPGWTARASREAVEGVQRDRVNKEPARKNPPRSGGATEAQKKTPGKKEKKAPF
jgi:hypothetical protein